MLHLNNQKRKEAINTSEFQIYLGGTAACMKILMISKKSCGQLTSNDNYFVDSWFSGVKTAEKAMDLGVNYCGPVKTIHRVFFVYLH